jgi:hypothetical protein
VNQKSDYFSARVESGLRQRRHLLFFSNKLQQSVTRENASQGQFKPLDFAEWTVKLHL